MKLYPPVQAAILVVDEEAKNLARVAGMLYPHYQVMMARDSSAALQQIHSDPPELVLLGMMLSDTDGYELCRTLKRNPATQHIPVVFLSHTHYAQEEQWALAAGAVDFITQPVKPDVLLSRLRAHLQDAQRSMSMQVSNAYLENEVAKRAQQLRAAQDLGITAMASLTDVRDADTGAHQRRTQHYVRALALQLQRMGAYRDELEDDRVEILCRCAPLHDIGKVGIPDHVLRKTGRLDAEEYAIMQTHPELGRAALRNAQAQHGDAGGFFAMAQDLVYSHHERWDGSGYPQGLAGQAIPLAARIMALADVYDALICARHYKPAMSHAQASGLILCGRGSHFDPHIVDAFVAMDAEFHSIAMRYVDFAALPDEPVEFSISALSAL